jgi:tRNA modification GTPase
LAESADVVERLGIARTRQGRALATVVVLVLDGSEPLTPAGWDAIAEARAILGDVEAVAAPSPVIVAANKCDLASALDEASIKAAVGPFAIVRTSATTGAGLPDLEAAIEAAAIGPGLRAQADPALLTARQEGALHAALGHVRAALATLDRGAVPDLVAIDVRAALTRVGEITGESATDALLNEIFSRFCIGK